MLSHIKLDKTMNGHKYISSILRTKKLPSNNNIQPSHKPNEAADLARVTALLELMQNKIADQQKQIDVLETKLNETADLARVTTLLELMQNKSADQQKQIEVLDAKASIILGTSILLAPAAAALFSGLISNHAAILTDPRIHWLLPALIIVYIMLNCFSCLAYTVRRYKGVPEPQVLFDDYRDKSEFYIKAKVFSAMVNASKENEVRIKRKVRWVTCSIVGIGIEALILAAILLLQVI